MEVVVEKAPWGALALVMVMGTLPVFVIWKDLVADVPTGTSPKLSELGICRCAAPATAVPVTVTVTAPRLLATVSESATGAAAVGLKTRDTAIDERGWIDCPTTGVVAGSTVTSALTGKVTPVTLTAVVPVLTMLTVARLTVFVGTSVNRTAAGVA